MLVNDILCSEEQKLCVCCWSLLFSLSSSFCGEASRLFTPGRSLLQLPTGTHSRSRERGCHPSMPGASARSRPNCVKVQLFRETSSTRAPSSSLYFSSHSGKSRWWPSVVSASLALILSVSGISKVDLSLGTQTYLSDKEVCGSWTQPTLGCQGGRVTQAQSAGILTTTVTVTGICTD